MTVGKTDAAKPKTDIGLGRFEFVAANLHEEARLNTGPYEYQ